MLKRSIKRAFAALLTLIVTLATFTGSSSLMVSASETSSWNFKNSNFKSLGTISSTTTVDGLTLLATSSKTMSVKADTQTVGGTEYTYCLATGGSGSTSYRAVKVPVSGSDTIKVTMKSSGSSSSVDTSDGTVVTSYQSLVSAISKAEQAGGGKVYVKGTSISCTGQIALSKTNAKVEIIGVQNSDGSYPVLDFNSFLQSMG